MTRERVSQIWTFINSKLKSIVLNGLRRGTETLHFLTFSCYRRLPLLGTAQADGEVNSPLQRPRS